MADEAAPVPSVASVLSSTVTVTASLDYCRNLVLREDDQSLIRVVNTPTGRRPEVEMLRGYLLLEMRSGGSSTPINALSPLHALLQRLDATGKSHLIDEVTLVFQADDDELHRTKEEDARARRNLLRDPEATVTQLTETTLLTHFTRVGGLSTGFSKRIIKELSSVPSGSCLHFSHANWQLTELGALLRIPPGR